MTVGVHDSPLSAVAGSFDQHGDCILGPSRTLLDPIDQWENEGGQVHSRGFDPWQKRRGRRPSIESRIASATHSSMTDTPPLWAPDVQACGRCHGPVSVGRYSLLGRVLSRYVPVEQYQCMDAACAWSGIRMRGRSELRT